MLGRIGARHAELIRTGVLRIDDSVPIAILGPRVPFGTRVVAQAGQDAVLGRAHAVSQSGSAGEPEADHIEEAVLDAEVQLRIHRADTSDALGDLGIREVDASE